ncbi:MAG: indolepyruvate ferredoxin oxidoreductase family protein, partial [Alphaproteobacteria bacterium]|nr:indolepyruvate ferredoxin oxidoreductase family protein [Alphaproteobacteria bacterium]
AEGRAFMTGTQALVRLCLEQRRRDADAGHDTAGYVTGYRGSPLGSVDKEFWRAGSILEKAAVRFHAAVNEDLAATAIWGAQQLPLFADARKDGVFAIWYGKGPGVDRSGDVFRHANLAGTSALSGVLALAGDDPGCKSSTVPSQSDFALVDAGMPLLHPADVREILDFGLLGLAMSRFSGCWVGMKAVADVMDTSSVIALDGLKVRPVLPTDVPMPPGGLHTRWPDPPMEQEHRLYQLKIPAAAAFARANPFDRMVWDSPAPRIGVLASGKTFRDVREALAMLGVDEQAARALGLRLIKIGLAWPLDGETIRRFARGLEEIVVIEEKRPLLETQVKDILYGLGSTAPRIVGKRDESGAWLFPPSGEVGPAEIARALAPRLMRAGGSGQIAQRLERLKSLEERKAARGGNAPAVKRIPYFCAGCPHNTSTNVPKGSRALAGIGCHYMAIWMNRDTATFSHMGGEGAAWIGQAPFSDTPHVFANIGDGTFFHSGLMAIRAAVAAKVNITYKILYNDAVAMTGGQPMDGPLDVPRIAAQVRAEGVERIAVVSDTPDVFRARADFPAGVTVHPRDDLDGVQRTLRQWPGVSALIYAQTCAAEKRRRRKRGRMPDPAMRAFINADVCEGCGDCGVQSNCVAIAPLETDLGRKRAIDQSACNKDFSCLKGFCPSFVTVAGGELRRRETAGGPSETLLPEPVRALSARASGIVVSGIGGTGVVTIGAILGMAAHIEGKSVSVLDVAGLAQKNGEVYGHIRIADSPEALHAARIGPGEADLLIGCDLITAASGETLGVMAPDRTRAVVNTHETMTAAFTHDPDAAFAEEKLEHVVAESTLARDFVDATGLAMALLGDSVGANMLLLGFACQKGLLPVSHAAIDEAIRLNGVAVEFNRHAVAWGRTWAVNPDAVLRAAGLAPSSPSGAPFDLAAFIERRAADLAAYQNQAYAARYRAMIERVRAAESRQAPGTHALLEAVARAYYKLLAYKDEYEVARLYSDGRFARAISKTFAGPVRLSVHLAPPILAGRNRGDGVPPKHAFGPWMLAAMKFLAPLKILRGTPFDPFGRSEERRAERKLIVEYETLVAELIERLDPGNHALAAELAALPLAIRGFGPVKMRAIAEAKEAEARLLSRLRGSTDGHRAKAAE